MGGFVSAPPRAQVHVVTAVYGSLSGPITSTRTRLWILLEHGDPTLPLARICRNDPSTGQPVYDDLGRVTAARSGHKRLELTVEDGSSYLLVEAPCVCGAGAAGMAGPVPGRYDQLRVNIDDLDWLEIV